MKRWIVVTSLLTAAGGVGVGGYTQRHLLLGDAAEATAGEGSGSEQGEAAEDAVPRPIALTAVEEAEDSPLPKNPLRHGHEDLADHDHRGHHDEAVIRGNDETDALPAPNFGPPPSESGNAPTAHLSPPAALPAEAGAQSGSTYAREQPSPAPVTSAADADAGAFGSSRSRFSDAAATGDLQTSTDNAQHFAAGDARQAPIASRFSGAPHEQPLPAQMPADGQYATELPDDDGLAAPPSGSPPPASEADSLRSAPVGLGVTEQSSTGSPRGFAGTGPAPAATIRRQQAIEGSAQPGSKELEGPQTPSLVIEKFAPDEIQIGKPATFEIKVRNVGQATAENVQVRDAVPRGTRLLETMPRAEESGGSVLWQLETLRPGEEKSVSMQLMPVGEGEIGSVATVTFSSQASVRTRSTRPQLLVETTAPRRVLIGENVQLSIRLSNPGTGAATRVVLEEDVPEGLAHAAGRALEFEAGTLKPGETRELELTLKAVKAGIVQNVLRARADANLSVESRADIEVIAPQLAVAIDGPSKRYLERQATHEITISNPGTAPARDVQMVAHLPKGLKFVSANNQGQYDANGHAVYWSLEQLTPSDAGMVSLTTLPMDTGQQKIRVESKASMNLAAAREQVVEVEGLAALFFEVADAADPIEVGGETVYEVRVINQGSKTSTNVRLAAALPPALKPLEAGGATNGVISGQQVVFEPLGRLAPKADALFRIRVQGAASGNQRVRVQLSSDEIPRGVTKEESTRVYADE